MKTIEQLKSDICDYFSKRGQSLSPENLTLDVLISMIPRPWNWSIEYDAKQGHPYGPFLVKANLKIQNTESTKCMYFEFDGMTHQAVMLRLVDAIIPTLEDKKFSYTGDACFSNLPPHEDRKTNYI